ncbi:DUF2786 domain-containing protein [Pseudomonas aeruginosa]|uniref:DUF2786 domain-containing protein n=1 Tax=Pseudomonas aeruginosa TaxID=287 RepID=UPI001CD7BDDB|nr:DUF2786 domain-containing protein [Pseudomonas aeruginosa]
MDQDRILDKIKKCLEMAKGRGSNPNEAEIALRHAHKLMEAYNLEMGDVLASMAGEARVPAGSDGKPPAWRVRLAQVCCHAFGTHLIICTSYFESASFLFVGCAAAPELTGYAYQVLERQLQKARKDFLSTQKRCKRSTKVAMPSRMDGSRPCTPRSTSSRASTTTSQTRFRRTWRSITLTSASSR